MAESTPQENWIGTAAAELLKLLGVIAGLGLSPLLESRIGWYWVIGLSAGGLVLLAGAALSLSADRKMRRLRAAQLSDLLLQETAIVEAVIQVHKEPQLNPELILSNPRLAALRVRLEEGLISERQFSAQAGQVLKEIALEESSETESYTLPASVIALGVLILLPAVVALLVIANRIANPAELAAYFSSPALLLWMAVEISRISVFLREKNQNIPQKLGGLSSLLHILSALVLWVYLGLFFGETRLLWLFIAGAGLAAAGAALRLTALFQQRQLDQQAAVSGSAGERTSSSAGIPLSAPSSDVHGEEQAAEPPATSRSRFEIFMGSNRKYYFRLRAGNGEVILASQGYASLRGCRKGIRSVQANARLLERFDRRTARTGEPYFVLLAANNQVIGRSESYSSEAACTAGIQAVAAAASSSQILDLIHSVETAGDPGSQTAQED